MIFKNYKVIELTSTVRLHGGVETNEILDHKKHEIGRASCRERVYACV